MERIIEKFLLFFYILMILIMILIFYNNLMSSPFSLIICITAFMNLFLYGVLVQYNLKHRFVQGKTLLIFVSVSTAITWLTSLIDYSIFYKFSYYEVGRSLFELAIIESVLIFRINTVKHLEIIVSKEMGE